MIEKPIALNFLDHVAIRVADIEVSVDWYSKVFGLRPIKPKEWKDYPVFMVSQNFAVALFPAKLDDSRNVSESRSLKIDHFAFNVDLENFEYAKLKYTEWGFEFNIQDHHYFHSIYTKDPSGHIVELTTLKDGMQDFYKLKE